MLKQNGGYVLFSIAREDAETRNLSITGSLGEKKALKTWRPVDVLPWPAYDPFFFPVESRAKSQSGPKDVLAKQARGTVSLFKYSKAHLQITFVVSHISSLANCIHQTIKNVVPGDVGKVKDGPLVLQTPSGYFIRNAKSIVPRVVSC